MYIRCYALETGDTKECEEISTVEKRTRHPMNQRRRKKRKE